MKKADVLIPQYIYDYGSGKYDKKNFTPEYRNYNISSELIALVNDMLNKKYRKKYEFNIEHSCGFCSGASVVNSAKLKKAIKKTANRKVLGFDMEAYVIAVINHLFNNVEGIVIKGIMDFGKKKNDKFKELAKDNSAEVAN